MKKYTDLVEGTHDEILGRERLEWSNFWYDKTNQETNKRVLLVGDSTARMMRSAFAEKLGCPVDLCGTSSGLHDILFAKQLDIYFSSDKYHYSTVFIQLGHHSRINDQGEAYTEKDFQRFESDYCALIDYLKQYCNNIVLISIFYSVIPFEIFNGIKIPPFHKLIHYLRRFFPEKYDESVNCVKRGKNEIIKKIAKKRNIPFCDINQKMLDLAQNSSTRYLHIDHVHFEERAKAIIIKEYCKYL